MTQLARGLGASLVLVLVAAIVVLVSLALYARSLRRRGAQPDVVLRRISALALVLVALAITAVTLVPTAGAGGERALNFVPSHGLAWPWQSSIAMGNILGNIGLFVPLGFLLPLRFNRMAPIGRVILVAAAASVAIELLQYSLNLGRAADVNDLIFNMLGSALGWTAFRAVQAQGGRARRAPAVHAPHRSGLPR